MSTTYSVRNGVAIFPAALQTACTLKNTGDNVVYVDSANIPDGASGFPLGAGSSMVWDANRPLYAYSELGSTLLLSDNAGNLFDSQAIAQSLIDSGLAADIAQQIQLSGTPPRADTELIYGTMLNGVPTGFWTSPTFTNVNKYQSLLLVITGFMTPSIDSAGYVILSTGYGDRRYGILRNGVVTITVPNAPIAGTSFRLETIASVNTILNVSLYGTYRTMLDTYSCSIAAYSTQAAFATAESNDQYGSWLWTFEHAGIASPYYFTNTSPAGEVDFSFQFNGGGAGNRRVSITTQRFSSVEAGAYQVQLFDQTITAAGIVNVRIALPPKPVYYRIEPGPSTQLKASGTRVYWN